MTDRREVERERHWREHARKIAAAIARHPDEQTVRGSTVAARCGFSPFIAKRVGMSEALRAQVLEALRERGIRVLSVAYDARRSVFTIEPEKEVDGGEAAEV